METLDFLGFGSIGFQDLDLFWFLKDWTGFSGLIGCFGFLRIWFCWFFQDLVFFIRILAFDRDVKMVNNCGGKPEFSRLSIFLRRLVRIHGSLVVVTLISDLWVARNAHNKLRGND